MVRSSQIIGLSVRTETTAAPVALPGRPAPLAHDGSAYAAAMRMARSRRDAKEAVRSKERRLPIPVRSM